MDVVSIDPRTGETVEVVAQETTTEEVDALCARRARRGPRRWTRSAAPGGPACCARSPTRSRRAGRTSSPSPTARPASARPG